MVLDSTDRLAFVLSVRPCCSDSKLPTPSNYSNEECHVCSCAEGNSSLRVPGDLKHGDRSEASPVPCAACIYALHTCVYVCPLVRGQRGRDRGQCISILGAANKVTGSKQEPIPTHEYSLRACGCGWVAPFATSPCVFVIGASAWGSRGRSGSGGRVITTAFGGCAGAGGDARQGGKRVAAEWGPHSASDSY